MLMKKPLIRYILLIQCILFQASEASPGNDLDEYNDCRYQCEQLTCFRNPYNLVQEDIWHELKQNGRENDYDWHNYNPHWQFDKMPLPLHLRLLQWNCESNCDYQCQILVTKDRIEEHEEVYQFHGKWPFRRIFGIQEFASMIFSIGNFIVHLIGFKKLLKAIRENESTPKSILKSDFIVILLISMITMFAWSFSTIFHIRDYLVTERLDYYFAGLTVLSGFYGIGSRVFKLYLPSRFLGRLLFTIGCLSAYVAHVYRLETDWLYTYNMQANITIGILQYILWGKLCFSLYGRYYHIEQSNDKVENLHHLQYIHSNRVFIYHFFSRSPKLYSLYPLFLSLIVIAGMSLEILDFPPIGFALFDAHSLWHLVTIFPGFFGWYDWMIWDINENVWSEVSQAKEKKEQ